MNDKIYDVAIIGSGPAGLTAAIYTTRGAASTVIVGGEKWGGQLMLKTQVDNCPALQGSLGPDLMQKMKDHALMFGAEFIESSAESIDVSTSPFKLTASGGTVLAKSVIIATGAETKWLDVPGVSKLIGRGVSSCAPCDAPFFKGKKVAVVGGGDSALEEADVLTKYTSEVTLIHRRDTFRASAVMQKKVKNNPKIKILWDTEVQEVKGEERVTDLILKNNKTGKTSEFPVDGLFIAIGHTPTTAIFQEKIKLDGKGFVEKFEKDGYQTVTSVPGIFVAGDVHDWHYKQAVTAAGFGCMAAMDAVKYLEADNT